MKLLPFLLLCFTCLVLTLTSSAEDQSTLIIVRLGGNTTGEEISYIYAKRRYSNRSAGDFQRWDISDEPQVHVTRSGHYRYWGVVFGRNSKELVNQRWLHRGPKFELEKGQINYIGDLYLTDTTMQYAFDLQTLREACSVIPEDRREDPIKVHLPGGKKYIVTDTCGAA